MDTHTSSQPLIFGHRGASAHAPENTIPAFLLAVQQKADGIEFDVKVTRDGKVIVLHDQTLQRTTNGHGNYKKYSYEYLRKLDAGVKFSANFTGAKIPLLEEVLDAVSGKLGINIELTNYSTPTDDLIEQVAITLKRFGNVTGVMFSSFSWVNLKKVRRLCPDIPRGLLALPGLAGWLSRSPFNRNVPHDALHPYYKDVSRGMVEKVHRDSKKVNVWTVNDPVEMRYLSGFGVDMLMTDDPALARTTLGSES